MLRVHPRHDPAKPRAGRFLHPLGRPPVEVVAVDGVRIHLEAVDGTPILDVKPDLTTG
ncbi:MAG TPA: hypothetical protein VL337_10315 [Acidimicrobiales bacterium]|nr:hypothetical protein [Acidimicrobiales bacterium]